MTKKDFIKKCKQRESEGYFTVPKIMFKVLDDEVDEDLLPIFSYIHVSLCDVNVYCGKIFYDDLQKSINFQTK